MLIHFFKIKKITASILFVFFCLLSLFIINIHPFLSHNNRVSGDILVFERWIYKKDNAVLESIDEFKKGNYSQLVIVGFLPENIAFQSADDSYVDEAKQAFIDKGFDEHLIHSVWAPRVEKHKTFSFALAFKMWLMESGIHIKAVNVFTFGVHAKKSELVFKQVLEPEIHVGILSAKPTHYNPKFWWLTKIGWKWVIYDFFKYIFAFID